MNIDVWKLNVRDWVKMFVLQFGIEWFNGLCFRMEIELKVVIKLNAKLE